MKKRTTIKPAMIAAGTISIAPEPGGLLIDTVGVEVTGTPRYAVAAAGELMTDCMLAEPAEAAASLGK